MKLSDLTGLGIPVDDKKAEQLDRLADIILDWNTKINVTAIREKEEFVDKNVIDSLLLGRLPEFQAAERVLDMGTGGGFPGLPLAIVYPDKQFVLADAIAKKLKVVADAAEKLGLANVSVVHGRAEDLGRDRSFRGSFPLVTSRAVANMSTLCEYCLPFVCEDGYFAAYKTDEQAEEIGNAARALRLLKGSIVRRESCGIEGSGHIFVIVKKLGPSPEKYPRKSGIPSKDPL